MMPDRPYFDALAQVPPPPHLPYTVALERQERVRRVFGSRYFVVRPRSLSADWFFRVACALWARREAKDAGCLCAVLHFVNARHLAGALSDAEVERVACYVSTTFARAPRRRTKKGWQRYEVVPFDRGNAPAEFASDLEM